MHDFQEKCFSSCILLTYQFSLPDLPLLLEILGNICIIIACIEGSDVMNFQINLIFLIEPFFYMTKKAGQIVKYLESEKSF